MKKRKRVRNWVLFVSSTMLLLCLVSGEEQKSNFESRDILSEKTRTKIDDDLNQLNSDEHNDVQDDNNLQDDHHDQVDGHDHIDSVNDVYVDDPTKIRSPWYPLSSIGKPHPYR